MDNKLHVSGVGKWRLTTLEADDAEYRGGAVKGWAAMQFAGTSAAVRLSGTEYVIGELTDPAVRRPIRFEQKLDGVLPITRVGRCTASGSALVQRGVIMSWSAQLKRCSV